MSKFTHSHRSLNNILFLACYFFFSANIISAQCGSLLNDCDGDGVLNTIDLDDDNDGILDDQECALVIGQVTSGDFSLTPAGNFTSASGAALDFSFVSDHLTNQYTNGVTSGLQLFYEQDSDIIHNMTLSIDRPTKGFVNAISVGNAAPGVNSALLMSSKDINIVWPGGVQAVLFDPNDEIPILNSGDLLTSGQVFTVRAGNLRNSRWSLFIDLSAVNTFPIEITYNSTAALPGAPIVNEAFSFNPILDCDADNDNIINIYDLDSDNDGCKDVLESGGTDIDNDGVLGDTTTVVDVNGQVTAGSGDITGGYNGVNGNESIASRIILPRAPTNQTVSEGEKVTFWALAFAQSSNIYSGTAPSTIPNYTTPNNISNNLEYQWYLGDPDTTGTLLVGETNSVLTFTPTLLDNGNQYYVLITLPQNTCLLEKTFATLNVNQRDSDLDGFLDNTDVCPNGNDNKDTDRDGVPDFCDLDNDNDGILDTQEGYVASQLITDFVPLQINNIAQNTANTFTTNIADVEICDLDNLTVDMNFVNELGDVPEINNNNGLGLVYSYRSGTGIASVTYTFSKSVNVRIAFVSNTSGEVVTFITPYDRIIPGPGSTILYSNLPVQWHNRNSRVPTFFEFDNIKTFTLGLKGSGLVQSQSIEVSNFLAGATCRDTDQDGLTDRFDLDSDNDGCNDVIEAGGTDNDNDGILGDGTITVDQTNGQVTTGGDITGGYPNAISGNEYLATRVTQSMMIADQTVLENDIATFTAQYLAEETNTYTGVAPLTIPDYTNATNITSTLEYQWYLGDPDTTGVLLVGEVNSTLTITPSLLDNGNQYCVIVTHPQNNCIVEKACATLNVNERDSDNDGVFDSVDICPGGNDSADNDNDGVPDFCDLDDDNDGILDTQECTLGTGNLVVNGDFESGNTGFTSSYVIGNCINNGFTPDAGEYLIGANPITCHQNFKNIGDHTSGAGNMMIINGGGQNVYSSFYTQIISTGILANVEYTFSVWVQNAVNPALQSPNPIVELYINNSIVNTPLSVASTDGWVEITGNWFSANSTTATIEIRTAEPNDIGNDILLDDISFFSCIEDTDNDGVINSFDLDSDNDGCNDVIEAGGTDNDNDGILGDGTITVDSTNGQVTTGGDITGGYPNAINTSVLRNLTIDVSTASITPTNTTINIGATQTLTASGIVATKITDFTTNPNITSDATTELLYEWFKDNTSQGTATLGANTLTINTAQEADSGIYSLVISHPDRADCVEELSTTLTIKPCDITNITAQNISLCNNNNTQDNANDDTFTADIVVEYTGAPSTGTLNLSGAVIETVNVANLNSSTSHTFTNVTLPSNGSVLTLTALFSSSNTCTLTTTINAPVECSNLSPVADDDQTSTQEDQAVSYNITTNDLDTDGVIDTATVDLDPNTLGVQDVITTNLGEWMVNTMGVVTYTPIKDYNGIATLPYTIMDSEGSISNIATITITVNPVKDTLADTATVNEDDTINISVLGNDTFNSITTLSVSGVTNPQNGNVVINTDNTIAFTPNSDFNGTYSFTYTVAVQHTNNITTTEQETVTITVVPVVDTVPDTVTTNQTTPVTTNVFNNDEFEGTTATITAINQPSNGTTILNLDGSVTYTPNGNFVCSDSYTYTVTVVNEDLTETQEIETVNIDISVSAAGNNTISICDNESLVNLIDNLQAPVQGGGTWLDPNNIPFGTNDEGVFNPATAIAGRYTYTVGVAPCISSAILDVTIVSSLSSGNSNNVELCSTDTAINLFNVLGGTPSNTGTWLDPNGNPFGTGNSVFLDPSNTQALSGDYVYQVTTGSCPTKSTTVNVTITKTPELSLNQSICAPDRLTYNVNYSTNGNWIITISPKGSAIVDPVTSTITGIEANTNVTITAQNPSNPSCTTNLSVTAPSCICPSTLAPVNPSNISICEGAINPELSVEVASGLTANWYDIDGVLLLSNSTTYTPTNTTIGNYQYFVEAYNPVSNCSSSQVTVFFNIESFPVIQSSSTVTSCASYQLPPLSSGNYFTQANGTGLRLSSGDIITQSQIVYIYANNATATNCSVESTLGITINALPNLVSPISNTDTFCETYTLPALSNSDQGYYTGPNGTGNQLTEGQVIATTQQIYLREVSSITGCQNEISFNVIINNVIDIDLEVSGIICVDENGTPISSDNLPYIDSFLNDNDYAFNWSYNSVMLNSLNTSSIQASQPGEYTLVYTNLVTGCSASSNIMVESRQVPTNLNLSLSNNNLTNNTNTIVATVTANEEYLFSLDYGATQSSNVFSNVALGPHAVTVFNEFGCGQITEEIFVFGFPKFFTPNNDGVNDTWNFIVDDTVPEVKIRIFNRYGKLVKLISSKGEGWDGVYLGENLQTDDYWFFAEFTDGTQTIKGHFTLKR